MDAIRQAEQHEKEQEEMERKKQKSRPRYVCKDKKPEMFTQSKRKVDKKVVAKPQLTQMQQDLKMYVGEALYSQFEIMGKFNNTKP